MHNFSTEAAMIGWLYFYLLNCILL